MEEIQLNKRIIMYFGIGIATLGAGVLLFASIAQATQTMEVTTSGIKSTGAYIGAVLLIIMGALFIVYGTSTIKADLGPLDIESDAKPEEEKKPIGGVATGDLKGPVTTLVGPPVPPPSEEKK